MIRVKQSDGSPFEQLPANITQIAEIQLKESRSLIYLVCMSECFIDLFILNVAASPSVCHLKKLKLQIECMCSSLCEEGVFYTTEGPLLAKMHLNLKS